MTEKIVSRRERERGEERRRGRERENLNGINHYKEHHGSGSGFVIIYELSLVNGEQCCL